MKYDKGGLDLGFYLLILDLTFMPIYETYAKIHSIMPYSGTSVFLHPL
jgi:hypothetical protein